MWWAHSRMFFRLGVFFFVVFDAAAIYGLVTTFNHFDDVVAACNKKNNSHNNVNSNNVEHLWVYVLARLVLSFAEIGALCFFYYSSLEKDELFPLKRASLVTILHVLYICASTDFLKKICDDSLCVTALCDASGYVGSLSFTGFVYLCIDAVLVLLYSCPMFIETLSVLDHR